MYYVLVLISEGYKRHQIRLECHGTLMISKNMSLQFYVIVSVVQPTWIVPVQQAQTVMAVTALSSPAAPATCEWTEHTSPEGYKYYYNINTGESKVPFPLVVIVFRRKQSNFYFTIPLPVIFAHLMSPRRLIFMSILS